MKRVLKWSSMVALLGLTACVTVPSGPSLQAMPGSRKSFEQFQYDDTSCRDYATAQIGGTPADRANSAAVGSAIVGTVIGAAAGAAIGGSSNAAGVGAGLGLITGSAIGAEQAHGSYYVNQRRFDQSYHQCMYARGHRVPVQGHYAQTRRAPAYPPSYAPPPPSAPYPPSYPPRSAPPPAMTPPANLPPSSYPPPDAPPPR